jgi:quinoprotein glucose dehydrogenase
VRHDVWDYDNPAQPILTRLNIGGIERDVVIVLTKMGLIFVLDRDTGAPVFPVEERAVPQNGVPGETLSPTQPFPTRLAPLMPSGMTTSDAWGLTPWDREACRGRLKSLRSDGLYTPPSLQGSVMHPFTGGGMNWGGGAVDPRSGLLVTNVSNLAMEVTLLPAGSAKPSDVSTAPGSRATWFDMTGAPYHAVTRPLLSPIGMPCNAPPWGELVAVDLKRQSVVWRSTLGTLANEAPFVGELLSLGGPNSGGPILTDGGLAFVGAARDSYFRAFDVANGKILWRWKLPAGGQATPMSYQWHGKSYVVIAAGGHNWAGTARGDYVVAFAVSDRPGLNPWSTQVWTAASAFFAVLLLGIAVFFIRRRRRKAV